MSSSPEHIMPAKQPSPGAQKLGAFAIWATGVGIVISGESFGWNLGWGIVGPLPFFGLVLGASVMYYALVQCLIELACVYPDAIGPHIYVKNAFGEFWGNVIAVAVLVEFLFATPAIASSLGEYIGFLQEKLGSLFSDNFCGSPLADIEEPPLSVQFVGFSIR